MHERFKDCEALNGAYEHAHTRTVPHLAISLDPWGPMLWGLCGDCENCVWGGVEWSGVEWSGVE